MTTYANVSVNGTYENISNTSEVNFTRLIPDRSAPLSHSMYSLISFSKSTPLQSRCFKSSHPLTPCTCDTLAIPTTSIYIIVYLVVYDAG